MRRVTTRGAIAHIRDAISLTVPETDNSAKNDKLYSRLVKCFLYLHDLDSAEDAVSSIGDAHLRAELDQAVGSMKALLAEAPDESVLRRQLLDRIPRYKPCPYVVPLRNVIRLLTGVKTRHSRVFLCRP